MHNSNSSDQTNEDVFILDRDQSEQPRQRPNTPPPNYNVINPMQLTISYEISKTEDLHVVLVHEQPLENAINAENEQGVIRRFTTDNPDIPDDEFVSPIRIRRFNQADQYSLDYIFDSPMSPISETDSSSEDYWSGSSWESSSSWRSYDSMRDDLTTLFDTPIRSISQFLLSEGTGQRSRGLSQPHLSCEYYSRSNPDFEE